MAAQVTVGLPVSASLKWAEIYALKHKGFGWNYYLFRVSETEDTTFGFFDFMMFAIVLNEFV